MSDLATPDPAAGGVVKARPQVPPGSRIYAIGDIHGETALLRDIYDQIEADAAHHGSKRRVVVHLGDYVDRGPDPAGVIDMFVDDPLPGFEKVWLKGNHEDFMEEFLTGETRSHSWLANGGGETLESYGVDPPGSFAGPEEIDDTRQSLLSAMPPEHTRFFAGLELTHREGDYLFVHAGIRPGVGLDDQRPFDLMWIRGDFVGSDEDFGVTVIHGHTPVPEPEVRANRIGIDTGAVYWGCLTCLILDGPDRYFLQT